MSSRSVSSVCFLLVHYFFLGMACRTTVCQKKTRVVTTRSILNTQHTTHNTQHTTRNTQYSSYDHGFFAADRDIASHYHTICLASICASSSSRGLAANTLASASLAHTPIPVAVAVIVWWSKPPTRTIHNYITIDYVRHNPNLRPSDSRRTPARRRQRRRQRQWTTDTARRSIRSDPRRCESRSNVSYFLNSFALILSFHYFFADGSALTIATHYPPSRAMNYIIVLPGKNDSCNNISCTC